MNKLIIIIPVVITLVASYIFFDEQLLAYELKHLCESSGGEYKQYANSSSCGKYDTNYTTDKIKSINDRYPLAYYYYHPSCEPFEIYNGGVCMSLEAFYKSKQIGGTE